MQSKTGEVVKELKAMRKENGGEYYKLIDGEIRSRQIVALVDLLVKKGVL